MRMNCRSLCSSYKQQWENVVTCENSFVYYVTSRHLQILNVTILLRWNLFVRYQGKEKVRFCNMYGRCSYCCWLWQLWALGWSLMTKGWPCLKGQWNLLDSSSLLSGSLSALWESQCTMLLLILCLIPNFEEKQFRDLIFILHFIVGKGFLLLHHGLCAL